MEHDIAFKTLDEWLTWIDEHSRLRDASEMANLVENVRTRGFSCKFCDIRVPAIDVRIDGDNWRETLCCPCNLNTRMRLVLDALSDHVGDRNTADVRVFAPEALTPFAAKLRERFPRFTGSEFTSDPEILRQLGSTPIEDLSNLSFADAAFDVAIVNDVFEHLADLPRAITELSRVLAPEGLLLATFPFAYQQEESVPHARYVDGEIVHLVPPEYHFDPVSPAGALVFQVPGWEILRMVREAGFREAVIRVVASTERALCGSEIGTLFLLRATR